MPSRDSPFLKGWMDDLQLLSSSTVFQSYQDNQSVTVKGCVQQNQTEPHIREKFLPPIFWKGFIAKESY